MQQAPFEFDLTPTPRILAMLGEINLAQWKCLAELVDNSVDGFLRSDRMGISLPAREVHIALPTTDRPDAKVTVRDSGQGMDSATLQNAVRAGWSGNDSMDTLGLFGMGFNIATARLGTLTTVWTTTSADSQWRGVQIDLEQLRGRNSFRTTEIYRPKDDPTDHGTEVVVTHLKPDQRKWLVTPSNLAFVRRQLGIVYSSMLRANGDPTTFLLTVNSRAVRGRLPCIWGGEDSSPREVQTARFGAVSAYQRINVPLEDRGFCVNCWNWLVPGETTCVFCDSAAKIIVRHRRIRGWVGLQRYLSQKDYGIDILRNGRKIEVANKDFFRWPSDETGDLEYPIDEQRSRGGRMVGEIHLDHCRVMYTKDRFDRSDPAWAEMIRVVRGDGPLQPLLARQQGFSDNESPLFRLYQLFRRNTPHNATAAGAWSNILMVKDNDQAAEMAEKFYRGDQQYQSDEKWWALVEEEEGRLLRGGAAGGGGSGFIPRPNPGVQHGPNPAAGGPVPAGRVDAPVPPPVPVRLELTSLSREYTCEQAGNLRWEVRAYRVRASDPALQDATRPWALSRLNTGVSEFFIDIEHPIFRSATMTPLDGLLSELAAKATDFLQRTNQTVEFSTVLAGLRERYATAYKLEPAMLAADANATLLDIARSLADHLSADDSEALFSELPSAEQDAIRRQMAARRTPNPQQVIAGGRFVEFAPRKTILTVFQQHPDLFLDGRYWDIEYDSLDYGSAAATETARAAVVQDLTSLLTDALWLAEQDTAEDPQASRARLLRGMLALELLSPTAAAEMAP